MKKNLPLAILITISTTFLSSCFNNEEWTCVTSGKAMYSMSKSGKIGSADKGCSCSEIKSFEHRVFGRVDKQALKSDFGC